MDLLVFKVLNTPKKKKKTWHKNAHSSRSIDTSIVARAFVSKPGDPNSNPTADSDKNGVVNTIDVSRVAKDLGKAVDP